MRLDSFRTFHKTTNRIRLLYDVTIHSYKLMYDSGRESLKTKEGRDGRLTIELEEGAIKRPLKVVTFHAKDVYPQLLRSTLLIRLVAAYEAFLVDTIDEVARRSDEPFASDKRLEMSQKQLLALDKDRALKAHIVERTTRQLTSGGLEEIRKFYVSSLKVDLVAPGQSLPLLQEIHDRRHLYVHRAGYADSQYCHSHPKSGFGVDELVPVDERYLVEAMAVLHASALAVKIAVEKKYPEPIAWKYLYGDLKISDKLEQLVCVSATALNLDVVKHLTDVNLKIGSTTLREIACWVATDGRSIRWMIGGSGKLVTSFFRFLHGLESDGDIRQTDSFKVKRDDS